MFLKVILIFSSERIIRTTCKNTIFYGIWNSRPFLLCYAALCNIWPFIGALFSMEILPKSDYWIWIYTIHMKICHVQSWAVYSISKATGNRTIRLGQFFTFSNFSLFYWLKLSKSMPFDKIYGLGWFLGKVVV